MVKQAVPGSSIKQMPSPLLGIAGSIVFVTAILAVMIYFDVHEEVIALMEWFDRQGAWAPVLFILLMAMVVVLILPGFLLTTGAGFVFGLVEGTLYVVTGTTLGAILAFLIARHLFGMRARRFIMNHDKLQLVNQEFTAHGWKIVLLTRLIPFFPSKIANYFYGLTGFSLRGFAGGSLLGFIPFSLHNVYLGSMAANLSAVGAHDLQRTPLQWSLYGAGFIATVAAVLYLNHLARRALARYSDQETTVKELP